MSDNSGVFTGFPSPSPITYTTTTNTTSGANNALGLQLFGNSGVFPASSTPSTITYTRITNDGNALLGHPPSVPTPSPTSSGDKRKPKRKARSSAHATNTRGIKASGAEKKRHHERYIRMPTSCEHCRQQRTKCQRNRLEDCIQCTDDDCECIFVVKAKRGAKISRELVLLGRMFSDSVIAGMPSTPSLASSSRASSMSPITPITPARSTVELSSGPSSAGVSAGLTSGFATPHIFMPFVPPTQVVMAPTLGFVTPHIFMPFVPPTQVVMAPTSGFATSHCFMPFVPPTQVVTLNTKRPAAVDTNGMLTEYQLAKEQQMLFDKVDSWCSAVAAASASEL